MSEEFSLGRDSTAGATSGKRAKSASDPGTTEWDLPERVVRTTDSAGVGDAAPPFPPFPGMEEEDSRPGSLGIDPVRYLKALWRRRYLVIGITLAFILLFITLALTLIEHKWEASTTLIKRQQSDEFAIGERPPFKVQEYSTSTLLDTLKLPSSLREVMRRAGVEMELPRFASLIDVSMGKDSNALNLKMTWNDPVKAAEIANQLAEVFVNKTREIRSKDAQQAFVYYSSQLKIARAEARSLYEELVAFQQENRISDLDAQTEVLLTELSRLRSEAKTRKAETAARHEAHASLAKAIEAEPEMIVSSMIYRSPLKQRLANYEWELQ